MPTVTVLGVDDWAWRKGQRYGTILVDLESHRAVDLLPERSASTFSVWLLEHPGVQIVSRDRAGYYADGAREGAPDATQVADRFHLMHNVHEALTRVMNRHHRELREAAKGVILPALPETPESLATAEVGIVPTPMEPQADSPPAPIDPASPRPNSSHERRQELYRKPKRHERAGANGDVVDSADNDR